MKRKLLSTTVLVGAISLATVAPATSDSHPAITSPEAGQVVYENTLVLAAHDSGVSDGDVNWAVRDGCAPGGTNFAGGGPNVSGVDDPYTWEDGEFSATLDLSSWDAGEYCFIFNPVDTPTRLLHVFYIVDDYVLVGGTLEHGESTGKGSSLTHSLDGVVGDAGTAGIVGSVAVNYRNLNETVTYFAADLLFRSAAGIGAHGPMDVAEITATDGAKIFVLDRDASESYPRGAVIVRAEGSPSTSDYEIDSTPGSTGADSWVPMDRGNNHTGTR
jgi:hypothetical protein